MTQTVAALPVVRALLDEAKRKNYTDGGVLGVRARPEWDGPTDFEHDGLPVHIAPCPSALAVREALLERAPQRWLVILTDRSEQDLGVGITGHFAWETLRTPDPWDAVRDRFAATRIDHRLVTAAGARGLATGLLAAAPASGWPPARGGLLTQDHALGSVAAVRLGLGVPGRDIDAEQVLSWSTRPGVATDLADLRALTGPDLVEALLGWLSRRCGAAGAAAGALFAADRPHDLVPVGLVVRAVLATAADSAPRALLRRELDARLSDAELNAWAGDAEAVTRQLLDTDQDATARVLARADTLLGIVEVADHAGCSTLLRHGLTDRLAELGEALHRCADRATARVAVDGPDADLVDGGVMAGVEAGLEAVLAHALARHPDEQRVPRALAGVRLARWLSCPIPPAARQLAAALHRYRDEGAWVDRAAADAWSGVGDESLAQGLRSLLAATRLRRDAHDAAFGAALAAATGEAGRESPDVTAIESLLASTLVPLAKQAPVLLVVADGMSAAVGTEVVDDMVRRYESWLECLPAGRERRTVAVSALPSLTSVSRASLLCGELTQGDQAAERKGFDQLRVAHGLTGALFHKLSLDSSEAGFALAHDVTAAVDDVTGMRVVACVLNTIDDALDRSDPGGTEWTADTVKHLRPLLERARRAGRVVLLTSDHGHVVERREGRTVPVPSASSNRSRPAAGGPPPGEGEVRVRGPRVVLHDHDAVLAVDERLRYGPLKAGYHGGAAPAEVVVPVHVLAPGEAPRGWILAPPQSPDWWRGPVSVTTPPLAAAPAVAPAAPPTLFDEQPASAVAADDLAKSVIASPAYREQRKRAVRVTVTDQQVAGLLQALLAAPAHRLASESAAAALGIAAVHLSGALPMVQRLLNVEQYAVLSRDPDGSTVLLDEALLLEQFEVGR